MDRIHPFRRRILPWAVLLLGVGTGAIVLGARGADSTLPSHDPRRLPADVFWHRIRQSPLRLAHLMEAPFEEGQAFRVMSWNTATWGVSPFRVQRDGTSVRHMRAAMFPPPIFQVDLAPFRVTAGRMIPAWSADDDPPSDLPTLTLIVGWDPVGRRSALFGVQGNEPTGLLQPDTRRILATQDGGIFTGVAVDPERRRAWILDLASFEVLCLDDSNGDLIPDRRQPRPAAGFPLVHGDPERMRVPMGIAFLRRGGWQGLMPFREAGGHPRDPRDEDLDGRPFWLDEDDDGVMDREVRWPPPD